MHPAAWLADDLNQSFQVMGLLPKNVRTIESIDYYFIYGVRWHINMNYSDFEDHSDTRQAKNWD